MSASIRLDSAVGIPLRDGVLTRAELWRDGAEGRPRPTILVRTPYGRRTHFHQFPIDPQAAHQRGFNLLIQDVRGRGDSDGVLTPFVQEGPDGVDTLDWIVARPWSDGRVVMMGPSYVGATQWLLAAQRHPALRAIAPMNSSPFLGESWFYRNGVREHEFIVSWIATSFAAQADQRPDDVEALFNATPAQVGELLPAGQDWLTRSVDDPSWAALSVDPGALGEVAAFVISGWHDIFLSGALRAYAAMPPDRARLLVGPWGHDNYAGHVHGNRRLGWAGSSEAIKLGERVLDFYDAALEGKPLPQPVTETYDLGTWTWTPGTTWPPGDDEAVIEFGDASFSVDLDNLPVLKGGHGLAVFAPHTGWGPADCTEWRDRPDVAVLRAPALAQSLAVAGPLVVEAESNAGPGGAQWVALLCRVEADERLQLITEGVARADGSRVRVELGPWNETFPAGTRLAVALAGGSFPRWERPTAGAGRRQVTQTRLRLQVARPSS